MTFAGSMEADEPRPLTAVVPVERPILFSGEMVRAILDGRKTQTRRLVSSKDIARAKCASDCTGPEPDKAWPDPGLGAGGYLKVPCAEGAAQRVRYRVSIGDRLWVRETFAIESNMETGPEHTPPFADGRPVKWAEDEEWGRYWCQPHYRATEKTHELVDMDGDEDDMGKWRPSIFMPRWASRISLDVTGVRVERLHAITEEDAKAEGVGDYGVGYIPALIRMGANRYHFATLWDQINGKRADWMSNPWVWVVNFKRVP
jgi:hypothetical protein